MYIHAILIRVKCKTELCGVKREFFSYIDLQWRELRSRCFKHVTVLGKQRDKQHCRLASDIAGCIFVYRWPPFINNEPNRMERCVVMRSLVHGCLKWAGIIFLRLTRFRYNMGQMIAHDFFYKTVTRFWCLGPVSGEKDSDSKACDASWLRGSCVFSLAVTMCSLN